MRQRGWQRYALPLHRKCKMRCKDKKNVIDRMIYSMAMRRREEPIFFQQQRAAAGLFTRPCARSARAAAAGARALWLHATLLSARARASSSLFQIFITSPGQVAADAASARARARACARPPAQPSARAHAPCLTAARAFLLARAMSYARIDSPPARPCPFMAYAILFDYSHALLRSYAMPVLSCFDMPAHLRQNAMPYLSPATRRPAAMPCPLS